MNPRELIQARKSICIACKHLSIWHVEFERRICARNQIPPEVVLQGLVDDCPNFEDSGLRTGLGPLKTPEDESYRSQISRLRPNRQYRSQATSDEKKKRLRRRKGDRPVGNTRWTPPKDRK